MHWMPCRTILNGCDLDLASTGKRCCSHPPPGSPLPDWEGHFLLLLLPSECEDPFRPPAPRVLSVYLPRVGPQDDQSFLRRPSTPFITRPSSGQLLSRSSSNLRQVSGAEEILFIDVRNIRLIISQSGSEPVCLWWDEGDLDQCAFGV